DSMQGLEVCLGTVQAALAHSGRDPPPRSRAGPPADLLPEYLLRLPLGYDPLAGGRALPHLLRAPHDRDPGEHRRVRPARPEALRRHGADPRRAAGVGLRQRAWPGRAAHHESPAQPVPDPERGPAVRAVHVHLRADPLERALRLAAPRRARETRELPPLAR